MQRQARQQSLASEAPTPGGSGLPGNRCRAYRGGQVCAEAAANQVEVMRRELTPPRRRRGRFRGTEGKGTRDVMTSWLWREDGR